MEVKETVIRRMTRLAIEHGAVNLSQGFTDEAPVFDMVWGGISAMLGGTQEGVDRLESMTLRDILDARGAGGNSLDVTLKELLAGLRNPRDQLNQYSFPFGIPELRHAIADYTEDLYGWRPDPEEQITVVLGASEGMAVAFRSLLEPGDGVVVMQPYHELYPSQAAIFGLVPKFVTLREDREAGTWRLDRDEVRAVACDPSVKAFVVNTPQNPTGKVLDEGELSFIAELCREHDLFAITDEIYEHITFDGHRHSFLPSFEGMADRTLVVNSISKTGRSTGWRIGWVITPPERTRRLRAVHDNLVVQAPTPLQKGAVALLRQDRGFFDGIAGDYRRNLRFAFCRRDRATARQALIAIRARAGPGLVFCPPGGQREVIAGLCSSRAFAKWALPRLHPKAPTICLSTTARSRRWRRCLRSTPPCIWSRKSGWRRCRATISTPPATMGIVISGSRSVDRSKRLKRASSDCAPGSDCDTGAGGPVSIAWAGANCMRHGCMLREVVRPAGRAATHSGYGTRIAYSTARPRNTAPPSQLLFRKARKQSARSRSRSRRCW